MRIKTPLILVGAVLLLTGCSSHPSAPSANFFDAETYDFAVTTLAKDSGDLSDLRRLKVSPSAFTTTYLDAGDTYDYVLTVDDKKKTDFAKETRDAIESETLSSPTAYRDRVLTLADEAKSRCPDPQVEVTKFDSATDVLVASCGVKDVVVNFGSIKLDDRMDFSDASQVHDLLAAFQEVGDQKLTKIAIGQDDKSQRGIRIESATRQISYLLTNDSTLFNAVATNQDSGLTFEWSDLNLDAITKVFAEETDRSGKVTMHIFRDADSQKIVLAVKASDDSVRLFEANGTFIIDA